MASRPLSRPRWQWSLNDKESSDCQLSIRNFRAPRIKACGSGVIKSRISLAKPAQHHDAADAEANDPPKGGDQHGVRAEMQSVSEQSHSGENYGDHIQPQRSVNADVAVASEPDLQKEGGPSDCA